MSVGFDGHGLEDYDAKRVTDACRRLEELGIQDGDTVDIYDFEFEYQR